MLKIALTHRFVNALVKKLLGKVIEKKLGTDGKVVINELYAVENDGLVKLKIDAEVELTSVAAEELINSI